METTSVNVQPHPDPVVKEEPPDPPGLTPFPDPVYLTPPRICRQAAFVNDPPVRELAIALLSAFVLGMSVPLAFSYSRRVVADA